METSVGHRVRVLVVDDDRDTVMTLGILLRSEGFDVQLAQRGAEVLAVVDRFRPHAVLLDLIMPDHNGFELARELKRRHSADCPVLIALTGRRAPQAETLAAHSGFKHFLRKPYDPNAVLKLVGSLQLQQPAQRSAQH